MGLLRKRETFAYDNENESEKLFDATFFEPETESGRFSPFCVKKKC